jgi:beta-glucosidase
VLFPFGHGLSYTRFEYGGLRVDKPELTEKDTLAVSLTVKNTGSRFGKEAVQLYIGRRPQAAGRPVRELRGVSKVALEPGQSKEVSFTLDTRAFSYYDTRVHDFAAESGTYVIEAGSSSRDLRLCAEVKMNAAPVPVKYDRCSTVGEIMSSPKGRAALGALIAGQKGSGGDELGAGTAEMRERMMEEMPLSALVHFAGLSDEAVDAIIESVNS